MKGRPSPVGSERVSANGYHYTKVESGWELTHRLTAEKKLGRPLLPNERVRLIDGDRTNYLDPDNIDVYVAKQASNARRIAQLEAKISELQAELDDLRSRELTDA